VPSYCFYLCELDNLILISTQKVGRQIGQLRDLTVLLSQFLYSDRQSVTAHHHCTVRCSHSTPSLYRSLQSQHTVTVPFAAVTAHHHCTVRCIHSTPSLYRSLQSQHTITVPFAAFAAHRHCTVRRTACNKLLINSIF